MKRLNSYIAAHDGFTLIEIIATIIALGILAAFFIHFMGTALDDSWESVELVKSEAEAEGIMEEIIAYYTSKINDDSDLDNALSKVVSQYSSVATMEYIEFDAGGNEQADSSEPYNNLKVTVEITDAGEDFSHNLTTILTKSRSDSSDPFVYY
jgi:prepilin-type N-terminal cleavage/methylation domain-containing protein